MTYHLIGRYRVENQPLTKRSLLNAVYMSYIDRKG